MSWKMFRERDQGSTLSKALLCQGQRMTLGLNNKDVGNYFDRNSFGRTVGLRLDLE